MAVGKICLLLFAGFTLMITIAAIGMTGYFTKPHCSVSSASENVKVACHDNMVEMCPGAYNQYLVTGSITAIAKCPWKPATYVIGLISLCLVIILIIILVIAMRGIPLKTPYTLVGLLAIVLLITSIGLMIKDLVNGFKYYKDQTSGTIYYPAAYIVNALLLVPVVICTSILICFGRGFKSGGSGGVKKISGEAKVKIPESNQSSQVNTPNVVPNNITVGYGYNNSGYPQDNSTTRLQQLNSGR